MKIITQSEVGALAIEIVSGLLSGKFARLGFTGPLGAGKTTIIKAVLKRLGVKQDTASPTFNIIREYKTKHGAICHIDLYRIDPDDNDTIAMIADAINSSDFALVEWADRSEAILSLLDKVIALSHSDKQGTRGVEGL